MKNTLLFIALFATFAAFGHPAGKRSATYPSPFQYTVTGKQAGTKAELFTRAYAWLAKTFTAKDVIQMHDNQSGMLIGKGTLITENTAQDAIGDVFGDDKVHYTITINVTDGAYTCTIGDYVHEGGRDKHIVNDQPTRSFGSLNPETAKFQHRRYVEVKAKVDAQTNHLLASLQAAMSDS